MRESPRRKLNEKIRDLAGNTDDGWWTCLALNCSVHCSLQWWGLPVDALLLSMAGSRAGSVLPTMGNSRIRLKRWRILGAGQHVRVGQGKLLFQGSGHQKQGGCWRHGSCPPGPRGCVPCCNLKPSMFVGAEQGRKLLKRTETEPWNQRFLVGLGTGLKRNIVLLVFGGFLYLWI